MRTALMVAGTEPTEVCTYHRRGPLWHDLPPRYAAWLAERHRRGAAGRYRLAGFTHDLDRLFGGGPPPTGAAPVAAAPRIVEPLEGERRLLADTPVLPLRAECEAALPWVAWYVDGVEVGRVGPPYELRWRPTRGRHEILAAGPAGLADRVTVRVE
ncbi:MAG: hypothetical protein D6739_01070 [Nitrospirae bacterium]|nr:MAG: hypothetical protein D6739_01070 [Nitrospirota bacterium]